ncbi:hypothetical protein V6N13_029625 [Hibiscus sabdariffa]|uniref:Uncharacterized protein n=1 Tax=Hibiscus sabdariffa TaxID=183260 RepID=A0ABR2T9F3_9ROSI
MKSTRFLYSNGVVSCSSDVPPVATFLKSLPGAYTTTRTHENGTTLLFWESHLKRLSNSARILVNSSPNLILKANKKNPSFFPPLSITSSLKWETRIRSLLKAMGNVANDYDDKVFQFLDVHLHIGSYVPPVFGIEENGAHLALVGRGRDISDAKYSDWDKNEAEGKYLNDNGNAYSVAEQTAPISDGVLPGVIRQLVIE